MLMGNIVDAGHLSYGSKGVNLLSSNALSVTSGCRGTKISSLVPELLTSLLAWTALFGLSKLSSRLHDLNTVRRKHRYVNFDGDICPVSVPITTCLRQYGCRGTLYHFQISTSLGKKCPRQALAVLGLLGMLGELGMLGKPFSHKLSSTAASERYR